MARQSKYGQYRQHTVPRKKITIKVDGAQEDDGKWGRCWYCGQINNIDQRSVSDGFTSGNSYSIAIIDNDIKENGTFGYSLGVSGKTVLIQSGFVESHSVGSEAESGCMFCGSLNWR